MIFWLVVRCRSVWDTNISEEYMTLNLGAVYTSKTFFFIRGLFSKALSISYYVAWNGRMIRETWHGKNLKGSYHALIETLVILAYTCWDWGITRTHQSGWPMTRSVFEPFIAEKKWRALPQQRAARSETWLYDVTTQKAIPWPVRTYSCFKYAFVIEWAFLIYCAYGRSVTQLIRAFCMGVKL